MEITTLKYNTPFEVTKEQQDRAMLHCKCLVMSHSKDDKHYLKSMAMNKEDKKYILQILNSK